MQIRLTVVDPLGPPPAAARGRAASCDVLVTAPAGTALAAVASALASAVSAGEGPVVVYAGAERLDSARCTLGEPPLIDGAVLSLGTPAEPEAHPEVDDAPTQLHVVAGPDAGGVHLLHGGRIEVGRSADADVPLDDPDVSRLHCAVTVAADGRVSIADLGSTNGTTLDGTQVGTRPLRFPPGALLRIGESTLRLAPTGGPGARVPTVPDGEGHIRLSATPARDSSGPTGETRHGYGSAAWGASSATPGAQQHGPVEPPVVPGQGGAPRIESHSLPGPGVPGPRGGDTHGAGFTPDTRGGAAAGGGHGRRGTASPDDGRGAGIPADGHARGGAAVPGDRAAGGHGRRGGQAASDDGQHAGIPADGHARGGTHAHGDRAPGGTDRAGLAAEARGTAPSGDRPMGDGAPRGSGRKGNRDGNPSGDPATGNGVPSGSGRKGTPLRGTDVPQGVRRRGGFGAWARRLTGGRGEQGAAEREAYDGQGAEVDEHPSAAGRLPETWPDPAALLLTALGPGPRLWERGPEHPEALTVRLGTADRADPDGSGLLPAVPVTADLREAGALGLAGPRARLAGLARAVVAQLAALHSPDALEIVLISADRSRPLEERTAEWSWLGWLPHLRPSHGQDCRLLLAHDREQATARTDELLRRLDDHHGEHPSTAPARRPSWAQDDPADHFAGPSTVVVVDGDPGGADVREAVARLASDGPRAGIHVVCLAETPPASPASPVTETYRAACAVAPAFRECGAVALLSGDVATALRLMRVARAGGSEATSGSADVTSATHTPSDPANPTSAGRTAHPAPIPPGTIATVDAVSLPWAERFARALAPLRPDGVVGGRQARVSAPLPQAARLLDELGLARATPASLMARWADAADDAEALGGRACAVLGAGPRGPVSADLAADGPHLLIEGPAGSGRTELLRALVASLAAAERPDRLTMVLMDGRDSTGGSGNGDGLRVCTDVPHVTTHLTANDPVRMREFAQSLSAELKRRAELLGRTHFAEWHAGRVVSGRMVTQRTATTPGGSGTGAGDLDAPPSSTLRLRPAASRRQTDAPPPLPRLVVVVDDLDALVSPALGSPGRPAAGSVIRALEAVAREGERLGVHLVAATGADGRTAESEPARRATLQVTLDAPATGPDEPAPGRGRLTWADGRVTAFQGGRVTGRIPRTATLRPTVVPLEWHRMGDPPTRRPVRELGNGPTDLALLASALERAAKEVSAAAVPSLL
ncbi:FtsK/SpoIIIE domain-containing protein [Streptomyces sp. NBC_00287]|uniref:FtsK/SpoIIIE domain-containing protein n=1 Tax=Streptomyces sp. NBC_00287 TaxID=2975702 RepID=UPI002E2AF3F5|nr:FtsK/SpoIIIE domain-containing protein [Streptomyces sp. NBC_00287]